MLPPLHSQGWASWEHAQRSFTILAAVLFRLKTMLKIVIIGEKTVRPCEPFHFLTAGGALDSADTLKTNQYRFSPQPAQLENPFREPPRLPQGKEARPHSWFHCARMHWTKVGFQGLEAGVWSESDRLAPLPPTTLGQQAHRSMPHLSHTTQEHATSLSLSQHRSMPHLSLTQQSRPIVTHSVSCYRVSVRGFYVVSKRALYYSLKPQVNCQVLEFRFRVRNLEKFLC